MVSTLSSYRRLQARPKSAGREFTLRDHLVDVNCKGNHIVTETTQYNKKLWLAGALTDDIQDKLCNIIFGSHDIGKASKFFQDYISPGGKNTGEKKSHSPLSSVYAFFAAKIVFSDSPNVDLLSTLAAMCVRAHHGNLDSPAKNAVSMGSMAATISEQIASIDESHLDELDDICKSISLPPFSQFKNQCSFLIREFKKLQGKKNYCNDDLTLFYHVASLFSALIDADRLSAAELELPKRHLLPFDNIFANISNMQKESAGNANSEIVKMRETLFKLSMEKANKLSSDERILSLTAPTGSGKTLSSLSFALRLKERHYREGIESRIIYVAPFLSIIDQNLEVFKKALGEISERSDIVLAHHHLCEMNYKGEDIYSTGESVLLIEGWHSEIVVTTLVQFAYTILGRSANGLRKFHNLSGSIVILDEVQSIPTKYWQLIREALRFLADYFGVTFILMTATQPLIFGKDEITEIVDESQIGYGQEKCMLDASMFKQDANGRNKTMSTEEFANYIVKSLNATRSTSNVMIVMNTILSASVLFDELSGKLRNHDCYYLSAEVIPKERKQRLELIKKLMTEYRAGKLNSKPVLLVTTQLIEAGVDIDFDLVFRDLGPIDSIVQCAGRCNRDGNRLSEASKIVVVELVDEAEKSFARKIYGDVLIQATKDILSSFANESFRELSDLYYNKLKVLRNQKKEKEILEGIHSLNYDALDDFKIIEDTPGGSVFIGLDADATALFQEYVKIWKSESKIRGEKTREFLKLRSRFYQYVVNIPEQYLTQLVTPEYGIYYVSENELNEKYNEKGFVRNPSGVY
jgi:CRISPR-associated endonuclease/helicase Cas3